MDFLNAIWESKVFFLLMGSLAGGFVTFFFQNKRWEREVRLELHRKKYDEGVAFLDELSELIAKRFYYLQRIIWAISEGNQKLLDKYEPIYFEIVDQWNCKLYKNRTKLRLLLDEEMADSFLDYSDDKHLEQPKSLHYRFVLAHKKMKAAKQYNEMTEEVENATKQLNHNCSRFVEKVTIAFASKAKKLELLDIS